jgi:hypothetical protein
MDPVQQVFVADHIHELEREAAALRAERAREAGATPRRAGTGPRARVGRWLIVAGEAIAGRSTKGTADASDPMANPV